MLSVKQGGIKCHFLSLWYDLTWDWTQVSWAIGEYLTTKRTELKLFLQYFINCREDLREVKADWVENDIFQYQYWEESWTTTVSWTPVKANS